VEFGVRERLKAAGSERQCFRHVQPLQSPASPPYFGKMPRAIVSPSVLASNFGQLTAECKQMIKGGAEWLHMGSTRSYSTSRLG
jgi:hypothetical protein